MKFLTALTILFLQVLIVNANTEDMEHIRTNYAKAVSNKKLCKAMIEELSTKTGNPVHLAYLGALKVVWARHIINPIAKFSTFNQGKKAIELAIKEAHNNVEIRFIRLSVQKNCPSFLGYNTHIEQDQQFIRDNKNKITSARLKKMIAEL
jgi:hypothetical protein